MKQVIFLLLFVLCFNSLPVVGQNYVKIGQLYWGIQNLNNSTFRNGQEIARAKNLTEWEQFFKNGEPAYCSLNYNEKNDSVYGKIYNWFAVVDPRGLAPEGFKIPTSNEWSYLRAYLNYDTVCRCALYKNSADKLRSTNQWKSKTVGQNLFQMNVGNKNIFSPRPMYPLKKNQTIHHQKKRKRKRNKSCFSYHNRIKSYQIVSYLFEYSNITYPNDLISIYLVICIKFTFFGRQQANRIFTS